MRYINSKEMEKSIIKFRKGDYNIGIFVVNKKIEISRGLPAPMHPCNVNRMAYGQIPLYPGFILANENGWKSREDRVTLLCNYSPTLGRTRDRPVIRCRLSSTALPHRHYRPHIFSSSSFLRLVRIREERKRKKKFSSIHVHGRVITRPITIEIIVLLLAIVLTRTTHPH